MVKILNCYLYAKKSYGTLSKGAIFFGPTLYIPISLLNDDLMSFCKNHFLNTFEQKLNEIYVSKYIKNSFVAAKIFRFGFKNFY